MSKYTVESIVARYYRDTDKPAPAREASLKRAIELGASDETLEILADAAKISETTTIVLPKQHLETLSRGRGWARQGQGANVVWGKRTDKGYEVGPGKWVIGADDGFNRKKSENWDVVEIQVGSETWLVGT